MATINRITQTFASATSWDVDLSFTSNGGAIANGDLLVIIFARPQFAAINGPASFTEQWDGGGNVDGAVYSRVADGTEEGTTVTIEDSGLDDATPAIVHVLRIPAAENTGNINVGSHVIAEDSTTIDPPSVTAGWGSSTQAFIAFTFAGRNPGYAVSSAPTGYSDLLETENGLSNPDGLLVASAIKEVTASSDDPGVYTFDQSVQDATANTIVIETVSSATTTTMTFDQGSYSITGQDIALRQVEVLSFEQGTYTITGSTAELLETDILEFGQGSYSITGQDIGLVSVDVLDFQQGSYAITGNDIGFIASTTTTMSFDQGSYSITGQDIGLKQVEVLSFGQGSYAVTGQDIGFKKVDVLSFDQGSYNISGQPIGFVEIQVLDFQQGTYSITGQDFRIVISSPEVLTLDSTIATFIELDSEITTQLNLDSKI